MAEQVVDRIVDRDGREAPCRTDDIPLGMTARPEDLVPAGDLSDEAMAQLAFRYGHAARNVLALAVERPELRAPIVEGRPDLLAEVVIAARHEQARSVADVLLRRTRLGILAAPQLRSAESVAPVAELLGEQLSWSASRVSDEAEAWPEVAAREGIDPAGRLT
jgi:glycerol-3-phosphate dehydrogenase